MGENRTSEVGAQPAPKPVFSVVASFRRLFGRAEDKRETLGKERGVEHRATWQLTMSVEPDECDGGFVASCEEVPGAMGQGETEDEALHSLLDAINSIATVRLEQSFNATRQPAADGARVVSLQL